MQLANRAEERRHSFASSLPVQAQMYMLLTFAGTEPSFIAREMDHTAISMVSQVSSKWMSDKDVDQIKMLNEKLG